MNINENRVREFAHQIWESEGRPHGQDQRHWEMACRLAEEAEDASPQQQQAAPEHQTVEHNDTDTINKPGKEKTKALKKSVKEKAAKPGKKVQSDFDSMNQNNVEMSGTTAMEGLPELQGGAPRSSSKKGAPKTTRGKKAKLLKDVVDTEMSPVETKIEPV